jgi:hypothetical protein
MQISQINSQFETTHLAGGPFSEQQKRTTLSRSFRFNEQFDLEAYVQSNGVDEWIVASL